MKAKRIETNSEKRARRVRTKLSKINKAGLPRLSVFRSNSHMVAQIIDDAAGKTLASASSLEKDIRDKAKGKANVNIAETIGHLIAERAKKAKVSKVMFDRGPYLFHGRVKALADKAREGGLQF